MLVQRLPPTSTTLPAPAAVKVIAPRCSTRSTAFPACTAHSRLRISQRDATGLTTELCLLTDTDGHINHQHNTQMAADPDQTEPVNVKNPDPRRNPMILWIWQIRRLAKYTYSLTQSKHKNLK